jgi:hypothetical protein
LPIANSILASKPPKYINSHVTKLNQKIASENPFSFMTTIISDLLPLNYTATKYPEFRSSDKMIELHIDGRFLDVS